MGGQLSTGTPPVLNVDGGGATSASAGGHSGMEYLAGLSSYEMACRLDPELRSFDDTLQERTSRVISTLAHGVELRSLSFDSLRQVTGSLLEMNQDVVKVILEGKEDIWKNPELFNLVEEYFENSLQTLDFCTALEKCLKKARDSQLILHVALQHFEEEKEEVVEQDCKKKYLRTLEELRHFKAAGDPFTEEFFKEFQSVHRQQLSMLEKLNQRKNKLNKKLKSIKTWRKVSNIIFAATVATIIICSVAAAAVAAPPVAAALAAAASIPVGSMGKWIDSLFKDYQEALKGQKGILSSMQVRTYIVIKDLDSIGVLVNRLEDQINVLLENADFALRDEEAVKFGIKEIKEKVEVFTKSIEDLGEKTDQCSRDIGKARTVVLQRIIRCHGLCTCQLFSPLAFVNNRRKYS
ncbi:UPF0496 protein 1-like isoform X2 [Phoenix dactylifera]|uniref:UPF0496 protein 1-like isoform X2 n=1 Tax=Phoenix dactylifera TaxID=42345 RepID=A0A8B7BFT0_PHODC|nr:UPF0496 protein 1-like isoform X2 [Phoenix dactylifera]